MSQERRAEIFAKILSRAPIVPLALATPAAIVMQAADLGVSHAEEDCRIKVEIYNPNYSGRVTTLDAPVPCDSNLLITANLNKLPDNDIYLDKQGGTKLDLLQYGVPLSLLAIGVLTGLLILHIHFQKVQNS